jgi:hypothetical protein
LLFDRKLLTMTADMGTSVLTRVDVAEATLALSATQAADLRELVAVRFDIVVPGTAVTKQRIERQCIGTQLAPLLGGGLWDAVASQNSLWQSGQQADFLHAPLNKRLLSEFLASGKGNVPQSFQGSDIPNVVARDAAWQFLQRLRSCEMALSWQTDVQQRQRSCTEVSTLYLS